jgi:hypothetical protein
MHPAGRGMDEWREAAALGNGLNRLPLFSESPYLTLLTEGYSRIKLT